jgi:hypothetical protein
MNPAIWHPAYGVRQSTLVACRDRCAGSMPRLDHLTARATAAGADLRHLASRFEQPSNQGGRQCMASSLHRQLQRAATSA